MPKIEFPGFDRGLDKRQPHKIPPDALSEAKNIVRRKALWVSRDGYTRPFTAAANGFNMISIKDFHKRDNSNNLIAGDKDGLYYLSNPTWTNRLNLGTTRADTDKWFFAEIGNEIYACNGVDNIYKTSNVATTNFAAVVWDTTTDAAGDIGRQITRANIILPFKNRLWFFNITDSVNGLVPDGMRWTQANDFDRSETNDFLNLTGSHTPIISAGILLNNLISVYREDIVQIIQNPGVPVAIEKATFEPGILGPYAWCNIPGGGHLYVSPNGIFLLTGGQPQAIGRDNKMVDYFFDNVDLTYKANIFCWTDWKNEEVHIQYPTGSGIPNKELVYKFSENCWSESDMQAWCAHYRFRGQTSPIIYLGQASGHVAVRGGSTDNGVAIATVAQTKAFTHVPAYQIHEMPDYMQANKVKHDILPDTATIKVAGLDYGRQTPTFTTATVIIDDIGYMPYCALMPVTGHYFTIRIENFTSFSELALEWETSAE